MRANIWDLKIHIIELRWCMFIQANKMYNLKHNMLIKLCFYYSTSKNSFHKKIARLRVAAIAIDLFCVKHCILCIHLLHFILWSYTYHSMNCIQSIIFFALYSMHVFNTSCSMHLVLCFSVFAYCSLHQSVHLVFYIQVFTYFPCISFHAFAPCI